MRLDVYLAENKMIKSRELAKKMISEGNGKRRGRHKARQGDIRGGRGKGDG